MNIVAYCRVSTDKEDQLNSLEAQKVFLPNTLPAQVTPSSDYMQTRAFPERKSKIARNFFA